MLPGELKIYHTSKYLTADGDPLTEHTADAGGTITSIVDAALTEAEDYWDGAIVRFEDDTTTAALRGHLAYVTDFDAATDTLNVAYSMPAAPVAGDTYRLIFGAKYRSSNEVQGKTVDAGTSNITGAVVNYASYGNPDGNGTLRYYNATDTMRWQASGDAEEGDAEDVSADATITFYSEDRSKFIRVTITAASLPATDQSDTITLSTPEGVWIPDTVGAESAAGKTSYHSVVYKNEATTDARNLRFHVSPPVTASTTTAGTLGTAAASLAVTDGSSMPANSFWLYNSTKDDVRFIDRRSGNTLYAYAAGSGDDRRGFTAVSWDSGDSIEVYPDIDISFEDDTAGLFSTDISGFTYTAPTTEGSGIRNTDLAAGDITLLAVREVVPAGIRARADVLTTVTVSWE